MKPIISILIKNGKRYNWGHPVFLKIWKDGILHKIHSFEDGKNLMMPWGFWQEDETSKNYSSNSWLWGTFG